MFQRAATRLRSATLRRAAFALQGSMDRARRWPAWRRCLGALAVAALFMGTRVALSPLWGGRFPLILAPFAVVGGAAFFGRWPAVLASVGCAVFVSLWFLEPAGSIHVADPGHLAAMVVFLLSALFVALVVDGFHLAVTELRDRAAELARAERARDAMLHQFRHRTRNDLFGLVGLLTVRAKAAPCPAVADTLLAAADHAMALARIHTRLASAACADSLSAEVEAEPFVCGLVADMRQKSGPVELRCRAEPCRIHTERAVPLGLVLAECVGASLRFAFPGNRRGTVAVEFRRDGPDFVLRVVDDGVGLPPGDALFCPAGFEVRQSAADRRAGKGLGARLLRGLAAQLRGTFAREPGLEGQGTRCELRFPADEPEGFADQARPGIAAEAAAQARTKAA